MKTSIHKKPATAPFPLRTRALTYAIAIAFSAPAAAALNISQVPLVAGANVPANLMYIHDDSGSMEWSFVPDDTQSLPLTDYTNSAKNSMYYNPRVKYVPPPYTDANHLNPNGAPSTFTAAWYNGYDFDNRENQHGTDFNAAHGYTCASSYAVPNKVNLSSSFKPTFAEVGNSGCSNIYKNNTAGPAYYHHPDTGSAVNATTFTAEEKQNFANWYSYYRTRKMAAQAGIALAFNSFPQLGTESIRIGWGSINTGGTIINGVAPFTGSDPSQPYGGGQRRQFFEWLYDLPMTNATTPLRKSLNDAGNYYDRRSAGGKLGPWATTDPNATIATDSDAACRKSFTILMTDGYWNGPSPGLGNEDNGTSFTTPAKPDGSSKTWNKRPYSDDYGNTLGDVAWKYWVNDLVPGDNNNKVLPNKSRDPAWWQHMTTYTIGLGVKADIVTKEEAFAAADTQTTSGTAGVTYTWPNPASGYKIDDLLHAGVNGHGDYFAASDPEEFVAAMQAIIDSIANSAGGSGNLARNSGQAGAGGAYVFNTTYDENWNGELTAQNILAITASSLGSAVGSYAWKASEQMPSAGARNIYTRNNALHVGSSTGVEFTWDNLNSDQQGFLSQGQSDPHGENVLNYLRGSSTHEAPSGEFRQRFHSAGNASLGDSVNTTPIYDAVTQTLYQGANDGMLHAFNAETGEERFAYIPTGIFHKLSRLANPAYGHQYYVDGNVNIVELGSLRYLVGVLGRGGTGAYGLEVTHPDSFSASSNVKWELNGRADIANCGNSATFDAGVDGDVGFIIGKPMIASTGATGVAIVGNGYNSCDNKAILYVIDVVSGAVQQKIEAGTPTPGVDNGLSAPFWLDANDSGFLDGSDLVYAGDLRGNLWRFEYDGAAGEFKTPTLLFTASRLGVVQPITAAPLAIFHPSTGDTYVYIGTGQFLQASDKIPPYTVQSWYGLKDTGATLSRSDLKTRSITLSAQKATLSDGSEVPVRFVDQAVDGDMTGLQGWHIDFDIAADEGERIVTPSVSFSVGSGPNRVVLMSNSLVPSGDKCSGGGRGYSNFINAFTGGELEVPITDINHDGVVTEEDRINGRVVFSLGYEGVPGDPQPPDCEEKGGALLTGTTTGKVYSTASKVCGGPGVKGRLSWREIVD
jgi:type IV pilus assembly protein PilY1